MLKLDAMSSVAVFFLLLSFPPCLVFHNLYFYLICPFPSEMCELAVYLDQLYLLGNKKNLEVWKLPLIFHIYPMLKYDLRATLFFWEVFWLIGQIRQEGGQGGKGREGAKVGRHLQPAAKIYQTQQKIRFFFTLHNFDFNSNHIFNILTLILTFTKLVASKFFILFHFIICIWNFY